MGIRTRALKTLKSTWTKKVREMQRIDQSSRVRPHAPEQVIRVGEKVTGNMVKVDCGPAVFKLCERSGGIPNMFVVVEGSIWIQESGRSDTSLETMCFGTKVGYYRSNGCRLEHVFGVHYDMDERADGHPVFHAQMGPAKGFDSAVREHFRLDAEVEDYVVRMLRNVRIPTPQMDFFSVITQLCADHLMGIRDEQSADVSKAFGRVRSACCFLLGAGHRLPYLKAVSATECYRSSHWYGGP